MSTCLPATSPEPATGRFVRRALSGGVVVVTVSGQIGSGILEAAAHQPADRLVVALGRVDLPLGPCLTELARELDAAGRPIDRSCAVHPDRTDGYGIAVFGSVADARQALVLAEAGYGRGWEPAAPSRSASARDDTSRLRREEGWSQWPMPVVTRIGSPSSELSATS